MSHLTTAAVFRVPVHRWRWALTVLPNKYTYVHIHVSTDEYVDIPEPDIFDFYVRRVVARSPLISSSRSPAFEVVTSIKSFFVQTA